MTHAKDDLFSRVVDSSSPELHISPNFASNGFWVLSVHHQLTAFHKQVFFHGLLRQYVPILTCSRAPLKLAVLFSDTSFLLPNTCLWVDFEHTLANPLKTDVLITALASCCVGFIQNQILHILTSIWYAWRLLNSCPWPGYFIAFNLNAQVHW